MKEIKCWFIVFYEDSKEILLQKIFFSAKIFPKGLEAFVYEGRNK